MSGTPDSSTPYRLVATLIAWLLTAAAGLLMLTQAIGWNGNELIATLHALTPYVILGLIPVAAAALWLRHPPLALVAGLVGVGGLILAAPLVLGSSQPSVRDDVAGLRVAAINLLYTNPDVESVADDLMLRDIDMIVFSEYTAEHQQVLLAHPLADRYPHRVERDGLQAGGSAAWSKFPVDEGERADTVNFTLNLRVAGPDGDVTVLGVHPPTPVFNFARWVGDLETFGDLGEAATEPTLMIGDFNASYWHPEFRDLLDRGFIDAHAAAGRGLSTSWPTDEWLPPFVRLDHALTGNGLVSTDVEDFDVVGSDHRGFVVTVAPAR